jgi:propanol-preferring alcohol dehydrogenase
MIDRQLTLMGSFVLPRYMYDDMARFVLDHQVPLDALVTHRFPIARAPEAFTLFDSGQTGKVLLDWEL